MLLHIIRFNVMRDGIYTVSTRDSNPLLVVRQSLHVAVFIAGSRFRLYARLTDQHFGCSAVGGGEHIDALSEVQFYTCAYSHRL